MNPVNIPCPACQGPIATDIELLLQGRAFSCSNSKCQVSISLSPESITKVNDTYEELKNIKQPPKNK